MSNKLSPSTASIWIPAVKRSQNVDGVVTWAPLFEGEIEGSCGGRQARARCDTRRNKQTYQYQKAPVCKENVEDQQQ